jgi:hypothetical protein
MIIESFVICQDAAQKNNVDYDLLKSINDAVFKDVVQWTKNPTALRLDLSKFGVWYFKKTKTKYKKEMLNKVLIDGSRVGDEENIINRLKNFDFILSEYEKYSKDRYEIKCLKYGKENYEAFSLAKKQKKLQEAKENKSI